jgi:hypothetical protein
MVGARSDRAASPQCDARVTSPIDARAIGGSAIRWWSMTDQSSSTPTLDPDTAGIHGERVIDEAVSVIDGALARMMQRDLVSSTEVADLLLDLRSLLRSS